MRSMKNILAFTALKLYDKLYDYYMMLQQINLGNLVESWHLELLGNR